MTALLAEATPRHAPEAGRVSDDPISVVILAKDPISRAGIERQLVSLADIVVVPLAPGRDPDVALVVADAIDDEILGWIRTIRRRSLSRIVVVAGVGSQTAAWAAEAGANGVVPRSLADRRRLVWVIQKVHRGEAVCLLTADGPDPAPRPEVPRPSGRPSVVTERDREVLRLLAEGCDTGEIARTLAYSEPTIKNVIQRLFEQLKAKNRPHAVALALRSGII
jgi:DNA-binding NarL/FixJ family response regulator